MPDRSSLPVLVTGANSGIGLATVLEVARRGFLTYGSVRSEAKAEAVEKAVSAGAERDSVRVVDVEDVPIAYLAGDATRIRVKAVGDLDLGVACTLRVLE